MTIPSAVAKLITEWREFASVLRAHGSEPTAVVCERHADEVEAALASSANELLTLAEAAQESGLSVDHLARLVRNGAIPNAGRKYVPRLRRADLPRKATGLPPTVRPVILHGTSKRQLARSVVNPQNGSHDG
jgi:hypothetical protein